ncbi:MAG: hypothetical protein FWE93_06865 [Alphaproteobacteria bacterium]|nr:hypothetical protein [Alphaproteobacteria bacterium]
MKKFFVVAALICSVIATPAMSRDLSDLVRRVYGDPLAHLRPNAGDVGADNSINVEVTQVDFSSLPPFMQHQAKFVADCVKNQETLSTMKYFSYVSDFNRRRGFQPHYLIDTSALKDMRSSNCIFGDICTEGQCALLGYTADAEGWQLTINRQFYRWSLEVVQLDDKNTQVFISALYRPTGECEAPTGVRTEEGCFSKYIWGLRSLVTQNIAE